MVRLRPLHFHAAVLVRAHWDAGDEALLARSPAGVAARRLEAVRQRAMDPTLLARILREVSPYGHAEASGLDGQVETLRGDLRVRPITASAFEIEFEHRDPATAARVPGLLAAMLIRDQGDPAQPPLAQLGPGSLRFELLRDATVPALPQPRDPLRFVLLGALAGLTVGLAAALLAEYRDRSIKGPEGLEEILEAPLLTIVPEVQEPERHA
jgi:hypothetical protein